MTGWSVAAELSRNGYAVIPGVLDSGVLDQLRNRYGAASLAGLPGGVRGEAGLFDRLDLTEDLAVRVLTWPRTVAVLDRLGYGTPTLHSCYVSAKHPGAGALMWHCDVPYAWSGSRPPEVLAIYPLDDTARANGCLRVIPGSHARHTPTHGRIGPQHPPLTAAQPGERDVELRAGDLFLADRRILHATHPNTTARWRTCLTVAWAADFPALPPDVQELVAGNACLPRPGAPVDPRLVTFLPGRRPGAARGR